MATLVSLGWLEQDAKRRYLLASGALDVGLAALGSIARQVDSREVLEQLRDWTGFTASLAILDGIRATYVERLAAHGRGQYAADLGLRAGAHVPLHCTAVGKALLASLSDSALDDLLSTLELAAGGPSAICDHGVLRAEIERVDDEGGLAVSVDELASGVCSVALAVPALVDDRRLALEVNLPSSSRGVEQLPGAMGPFLQAAAKMIAIRMVV
jgi:IclR family acetate operon transcriptional repressor